MSIGKIVALKRLKAEAKRKQEEAAAAAAASKKAPKKASKKATEPNPPAKSKE